MCTRVVQTSHDITFTPSLMFFFQKIRLIKAALKNISPHNNPYFTTSSTPPFLFSLAIREIFFKIFQIYNDDERIFWMRGVSYESNFGADVPIFQNIQHIYIYILLASARNGSGFMRILRIHGSRCAASDETLLLMETVDILWSSFWLFLTPSLFPPSDHKKWRGEMQGF